MLGLTKRIVDLVSTGKTLKENGLTEVEKIMDVSSYLIVNRNISKSKPEKIKTIIERFRKAANAKKIINCNNENYRKKLKKYLENDVLKADKVEKLVRKIIKEVKRAEIKALLI